MRYVKPHSQIYTEARYFTFKAASEQRSPNTKFHSFQAFLLCVTSSLPDSHLI
jgi:hypothetical protein